MACTSDVLCLFPPKPPNLEIGEDISTGTYDTVYKEGMFIAAESE
jgi:hypothetical protein